MRRITLGLFILLCASSPLAHAAATDDFFDSNGVRIHYQVEGQGEPVLLVHGFAANIPLQWVFPGIMPALAKEYRVIAMDTRGHGRSGKPHDPPKYGMEMVEDCVRLLDHLKIHRAHVVGYSMGAVIAGKLIASHPDRVLSATLGGAPCLRHTDNIRFFDELADDLDQGKGIGSLIAILTPPNRAPLSPDQLRFVNRMNAAFNDPKALAATVRGWKDLIVTDRQLAANRVPTLALVGEFDPLKTKVDAMAAVMANLKIEVVSRADHMDAFGRPQFLRSLQAFLAKEAALDHRRPVPAH
jgi:pimeloyl-ACP methyl ester carboxylesterase